MATHRPTSPEDLQKRPNVVTVQPSSLVFLVIIAVWAAYFLQYWVRRREHLATARSVDQFSESMRVLERRSPLPASNLSTPQPRSYAVTPARAARPQVLVKRAETAPAAAPARHVEDEPATTGTTPAPARRTRAVIMLGALATLVVTVPLVATSLLPLPSLLVPVLAIAGAVAWARAAVRAQARSRTAVHASRRSASQPSRPSVIQPTRSSTGQSARQEAPYVTRSEQQVGGSPLAEETVADERIADERFAEETVAEVGEPRRNASPRGELYDVQAVESSLGRPAPAEELRAAAANAPAAVPMRPLVDEDDIPLTWDPVPVPRPTYTMKSRVTRPAPTSADLVGDADTEYAAHEDRPERRVAGA